MLLFVVVLALKKNWLPLVILTEVDHLVEWILLWRWFVSRKLFSLQAGKVEADKEERREMIWKLLPLRGWFRYYQNQFIRRAYACLEVNIKKVVLLMVLEQIWLKEQNHEVTPVDAGWKRGVFFVWLDKTLRQKKRPWEHYFFFFFSGMVLEHCMTIYPRLISYIRNVLSLQLTKKWYQINLLVLELILKLLGDVNLV